MSLFALRREYQRSIDRIFEDFSVHTPSQTAPSPEEVESTGEYEFIQYDVRAWACLLDIKRKG